MEKETGRTIAGSCCVFVPEEIVLAAGATLAGPYSGADVATEEVEDVGRLKTRVEAFVEQPG